MSHTYSVHLLCVSYLTRDDSYIIASIPRRIKCMSNRHISIESGISRLKHLPIRIQNRVNLVRVHFALIKKFVVEDVLLLLLRVKVLICGVHRSHHEALTQSSAGQVIVDLTLFVVLLIRLEPLCLTRLRLRISR